MIRLVKTDIYSKWLDSLRDINARARIMARVERLSNGNAGDVKPVGAGVSEMRINYGSGYRVYYKKIGNEIILLIAGGNKSTQSQDIKAAHKLIQRL